MSYLLLMLVILTSVSARDYHIKASDGVIYRITVGDNTDIEDFSIHKLDSEKLQGVTEEERDIAAELYSAARLLHIVRTYFSPETQFFDWVDSVRVVGDDAFTKLVSRQFASVLGANSLSIITTLASGGVVTVIDVSSDVLSEINGAVAKNRERRLMLDAYCMALTTAQQVMGYEQTLRDYWLSWETRSIVISIDEIEFAWESFLKSGEYGLIINDLINTYLRVPGFVERINNFFQSLVPIASQIGTLESLIYTNHHIQQLKDLKENVDEQINQRVMTQIAENKQTSRTSLEQALFFEPLIVEENVSLPEPGDPNEPIDPTFFDPVISSPRYTTLTTHKHSILKVAFSPNPRNTLAFGSADNLIYIWDTETKSHQRTLRGHTDYVLSVAYSPDGRKLASGDKNGTVRIWNAQTGSLRYTLYGHTNSVFSVAFSPDGSTVASGSLDGTIRLWDPDFGSIKKTLTGTLTPVISIAFNPIGHTLVSGNYDGTANLWNLNEESIVETYKGHTDIVLSIDFCPDGSLIASGSADGSVRVWETDTGILQHTFTEHSDWVNSVAFNPGAGNWMLASGSSDNTIRLWNTHSGNHHTLTAHTGSVESIAFSADGSTLASGDADGKLLLWGLTPSASVKSITVVPQANIVEDVTGDGIVNILDLARVASLFGTRGNIKEDVNGDGVVDIKDLILVANAFGNSTQSPSLYNMVNKYLNTEQVLLWLDEADYLRNSSLEFIRGIHVLESLLALLSPKETLLLANYPNPFNPETWIPFQLAHPAEVALSIYALDGRLIRTLTLGYKSEGIYWNRERAAYWDGRNISGEKVASGIYFYTLTAGNNIINTRKMIIRK